MGKIKIALAAAMITLCITGAMGHTKKKASVPATSTQSGEVQRHHDMATATTRHEDIAQQAGASEEEGVNKVLVLGVLTALCLLTTVFFSIFRVPAGGWLKWHKIFAYMTIGFMLIHGSLAFYGHFFG